MNFCRGLGWAGVEDDEYGVAVGGGEGGENGAELGMGRFREGKVDSLVCDGVIGSFKEEPDKLATVLNSRKEREERGVDEAGMGRTDNLLKLRTDSKQISRSVCKQPRNRHKIHDGLDLGLLTLEFLAGGADPERKDSAKKDGKCPD